jgi:hypothetical protein
MSGWLKPPLPLVFGGHGAPANFGSLSPLVFS